VSEVCGRGLLLKVSAQCRHAHYCFQIKTWFGQWFQIVWPRVSIKDLIWTRSCAHRCGCACRAGSAGSMPCKVALCIGNTLVHGEQLQVAWAACRVGLCSISHTQFRGHKHPPMLRSTTPSQSLAALTCAPALTHPPTYPCIHTHTLSSTHHPTHLHARRYMCVHACHPQSLKNTCPHAMYCAVRTWGLKQHETACGDEEHEVPRQ